MPTFDTIEDMLESNNFLARDVKMLLDKLQSEKQQPELEKLKLFVDIVAIYSNDFTANNEIVREDYFYDWAFDKIDEHNDSSQWPGAFLDFDAAAIYLKEDCELVNYDDENAFYISNL